MPAILCLGAFTLAVNLPRSLQQVLEQCFFIQHDFIVTLIRKIFISTGATVWSLHVLPMSAWIFLCTLVSLHIPKMCTLGEVVCLHCSGLSVSVCECALQWKTFLYKMGLAPILYPELLV